MLRFRMSFALVMIAASTQVNAALERMAEEADQAGLYDKVLLPEA